MKGGLGGNHANGVSERETQQPLLSPCKLSEGLPLSMRLFLFLLSICFAHLFH